MVHAVDPDDLIALGQGLEPPNFARPIENVLNIETVDGDPHAIRGYLGDGRIAGRVAQACGL